jgi:hypothetical protein
LTVNTHDRNGGTAHGRTGGCNTGHGEGRVAAAASTTEQRDGAKDGSTKSRDDPLSGPVG